jgi:deoxycytidylate deaminase
VNKKKDHSSIKFHLAKLLSLAHKPGCLTPTNDERGMQIASTARLMSGCLSRQVGAAIIGPHGYVVGIGWNDPPDKQVPCALRSCGELLAGDRPHDRPFSEYERSAAFRNHLASRPSDEPFCFRSELAAIKDKKEAEYTRALHAEENAFLQTAKVGGATVLGSTLYTTSSTCTLCAKKAYQLEVERIIYIERYTDLA